MTQKIKTSSHIRYWKWAIIVLAILAWFPMAAVAEDLPKISQINPVPDFDYSRFSSGPQKDGSVIREGLIERVDKNEIVISDVMRPLARLVHYLSEYDGHGESPDKFVPGTYVGYKVNENREVFELWLIPTR